MWEAVGHFFTSLFSPENPLWLYCPLCAVVAVVYKATKFDEPKQIALAALHFFISVTLGVLVLGFILYAVSKVL